MPSPAKTRRERRRLASPTYRKPDADDEAAFNTSALEIGIVFFRQPETTTHLNRILCLTCGHVWAAPKGFRVLWVGWYKHTKLGTSPPRSEREFKFDPDVNTPFRCANGCNVPAELAAMPTSEAR